MLDAPTVMAEGARAGEVLAASVLELPAAIYVETDKSAKKFLSKEMSTYDDVNTASSELRWEWLFVLV